MSTINKKIPSWSFLRIIEKNKLIQSTYVWLLILPVFAKLLSSVEDTIAVNIYGTSLTLDLQLPFSWKMFFISALLFTVANIVYAFFCPDIVKEHTDFGDFSRSGKDKRHLEKYMNDEQLTAWMKKNSEVKSRTLDKLVDMHHGESDSATFNHSVEEDRLDQEARRELISDFFWKTYEEQNLSRFLARLLANILYAVASILLAIVMYKNISYVFSQF